eukprot:Clim_evm9s225 gene=Clim_evmTU9s225
MPSNGKSLKSRRKENRDVDKDIEEDTTEPNISDGQGPIDSSSNNSRETSQDKTMSDTLSSKDQIADDGPLEDEDEASGSVHIASSGRVALNVRPPPLVKYYKLNDRSDWDPVGTGHVHIVPEDSSHGEPRYRRIVVVSDQDRSRVLLNTRVGDKVYNVQQQTLLVWTDATLKRDVALSFQEKSGCARIYCAICAHQGREPLDLEKFGNTAGTPTSNGGSAGTAGGSDSGGGHHQRKIDESMGNSVYDEAKALEMEGKEADVVRQQNIPQHTYDDDTLPPSTLRHSMEAGDKEDEIPVEHLSDNNLYYTQLDSLPEPIVANLPLLSRIINHPAHRDRCASLLLNKSYLVSLAQTFRACEEAEDLEALHTLFDIMKGMILLNGNALFEILFQEDLIWDVLGMLEYDHGIPQRQHHREFLARNVQFKEVVPFNEPQLLAKIHQTFRVQYLKDVVLPRILDEATFSTLNSLIFFNNVDIINQLQGDEEFLSKLFERLNSRSLSQVERRDAIRFIEHFCQMAKNIQMAGKDRGGGSLYEMLCQRGLLNVISQHLISRDLEQRMAAANIFSVLLSYDVGMVRSILYHSRRESDPFGSGNPSGIEPDVSSIGDSGSRAVAASSSSKGPNPKQQQVAQQANGSPATGAAGSNNPSKPSFWSPNNKPSGGRRRSSVGMHSGPVARSQVQSNILWLLLHRLIRDKDIGMKAHIAEMLRILFDVKGSNLYFMSHQPSDVKAIFSDDYVVQKLMEPIIEITSATNVHYGSSLTTRTDRNRYTSYRFTTVLGHVLDLLNILVTQHNQHVKSAFLRMGVIPRLIQLLNRNDSPTVLASVRLLRAIVAQQDEVYNRAIIQNGGFHVLISIFQKNGHRYNLLNSAIIELFDFIQRHNIFTLVDHCVKNFRPTLDQVNYVNTFKQLITKHCENSKKSDAGILRRRQGRLDFGDEEWFESEESEGALTAGEMPRSDGEMPGKSESVDGGGSSDELQGNKIASPTSGQEPSNVQLEKDSDSEGGDQPFNGVSAVAAEEDENLDDTAEDDEETDEERGARDNDSKPGTGSLAGEKGEDALDGSTAEAIVSSPSPTGSDKAADKKEEDAGANDNMVHEAKAPSDDQGDLAAGDENSDSANQDQEGSDNEQGYDKDDIEDDGSDGNDGPGNASDADTEDVPDPNDVQGPPLKRFRASHEDIDESSG